MLRTIANGIACLVAVWSGLACAGMDPSSSASRNGMPEASWLPEGRNEGLSDRVFHLEQMLPSTANAENGLAVERNALPTASLFGRVFADTCAFGQDDLNRTQFGDAVNGTRIRSARLGGRGEMCDTFTWELTVDFAGVKTVNGEIVQQTALNNVFLQWNELPVIQRLRFGHCMEPASLEEMTSSRYSACPERSVLGTFIPSRNTGVRIMTNTPGENATYSIGFYRERPDMLGMHDSQIGGEAVTMRATCLPWYDEVNEGRQLLHLGGYFSYRHVDDGNLRFRRRADTIFSPEVVDTGTIAGVADWRLLGAEGAIVYGPFSVQSEYATALIHRTAAADPVFHAFYVEASYFLTGENRTYTRTLGAFGRTLPRENAFRVRDGHGNVVTGKGAWQLAYRYGYIDLEDAGVHGNRAGIHSLGINWYMTPYSRLLAHYIHGLCDVTSGEAPGRSSLQALLMRLQFDF